MSDNAVQVLVVEDSLVQLQILRVTLVGRGFKVELTDNLAKALDRLTRPGIDVVMLDLNLPDSEGLDTLIALRGKAQHIPMIVLTSLEDEHLASEALKVGAEDYLIKGQADGTLLVRSIRYALERKRAQEALKASEEQFHVLVDGITDYAIFMLDPDGRILTWNAGAESITGYSKEEIVGKSLNVFYTNEDVERGVPKEALRQAEQIGRVEEERWRLRKDGSRFWANLVTTALRDPYGRLLGFSRIARDMTEKREVEKAMREKEVLSQKNQLVELLQKVTVAMNEALSIEDAVRTCLEQVCLNTPWQVGCAFVVDGEQTDTVPVTKLLYVAPQTNPVSEPAMVSTSTKASVTSGLFGAVWAGAKPCATTKLSNEPALQDCAPLLPTSLKSGFALPVREGENVIVVLEYFTSTLTEPDQPFLEIMTNIGQQLSVVIERKRLEEVLIGQAKVLAHSNAELQEFAKIAAHDLQEPLRAVQGFVNLIQSRYKDTLDDDGKRFFEYIEDAVIRMAALIQGVLEHSKIGSEDKPVHKVDCNKVLEEVRANLKVSIEENAATVTVSKLPAVKADRLHLIQLFQNLISNAIKFHGPRPPKIDVSCNTVDQLHTFKVEDNGIGMDMRYAHRIFGMFNRLHPKTEYPGAGIGLAVCKKIVEYYGGTIWLESEPGKGSTFYMTFPVE